jgi:uncharacterized protein YegL
VTEQPFGDVGFAGSAEPRCPCVLLLDVSHSMNRRIEVGGSSRIALLNDGVRAYQAEIATDSLAAQRVEVAVITFGGQVQTVVPFVAASAFKAPSFAARGDTPMGSAILHAIEAVTRRKTLYKRHGLHYYRPWVFMITDGGPTDRWQIAAEKIREGEENKAFAFFAVGVKGAKFGLLRQLSVRQPLRLKEFRFRELFVWLSRSHERVSHSNPSDEVQLPSPAYWAEV